MLIPKIEQQNLFYINGTAYQLRHVLAPELISVPKPFVVRYDGIFNHFSIHYRNVFKRNVFYIDVYKYKLPLTLFLYALIEPKKVNEYFKLPLLMESVSLDKLSEIQTGLLNTNSIVRVTGDPTKQESYSTYLDKFTNSPNYYSRLVSYISRMKNDIITKKYCEIHRIPLTLLDIIAYMLNLCLSGTVTSLTSVDDLNAQTLDLYIYKVVEQWLQVQEQRKLLGLSSTKLESTALLTYLKQQGYLIPADDTNPVSAIRGTTTVVYSHLNEGSLSHRDFNQDNRGIIDPIDTPIKDDIGLTQRTTATAVLVKDKLQTTNQDYPWSITTSLIPWAEHNDGIRLMMALNHARQAIPLVDPDVALIQTTFEQVVKEYSPFVIRTPIDGIVISTNPLIIQGVSDKIKQAKDHLIDLKPQVTTNKQLVTYIPIVTEKQKVKAKQIVAISPEFHLKGALTIGKTLYTAYFTTPYTFEDALAINKHTTNMLTSKEANKIQIVIDKNQHLLYCTQVNTEVGRGKTLLSISKADINSVIDSQLLDLNFTQDKNRLAIRAHKDVRVQYLKVTCRPERAAEVKKFGINPIIKQYLTYKGQPVEIFVDMIVTWEAPAVLGDKLTNRYGTKGVISKIFDETIIDEKGVPLDLLINSQTVIGRKNMGQFFELYASNLVMFAREKVQQMKDKDKIISFLKDVFEPLDNTENKSVMEAIIITYLTTGNVVLFVPPFKAPTYQQLKTQIEKFHVKTTSKITMKDKNITTEITVPVGYLYIYKLIQESEKKLSSRMTGAYSSLGVPMKTSGQANAQTLDELTLYTLISSNVPQLLEELHIVDSIDHEARKEMIDQIITRGSVSIKDLNISIRGANYLKPILTTLGVTF